ncbi:ester cyclase [Candidatus Woesearchaeota archaeon]|nr:ester cyclase [Candidatus Woesearchaeota archaeon]
MKKYLFAAFFLLPLSTQAVDKVPPRQVVETFYSELLSSTGDDSDLAGRAARIVGKNWDADPAPFGGPGLAGLVTTFGAYHQAVPNMKWTPQEILRVAPNRYVVRSVGTGTPVADFLNVGEGFKPGNRFEIMTIDIHTLKNGKIVKTYHVEDWLEAVSQLSQ